MWCLSIHSNARRTPEVDLSAKLGVHVTCPTANRSNNITTQGNLLNDRLIYANEHVIVVPWFHGTSDYAWAAVAETTPA